MNKEKLQRYKLTGSVHTLQVRCQGEIMVPEEMSDVVDCRMRHNKKGELYSLLVINPNVLNGDIFNYSDYQTATGQILSELKVSDYQITRTDLRLDSLQKNFYQDYWKIHRFLLSGLALAYSITNKYRTEKLDSNKKISLSVKTSGFQVEFYDKLDEMNGSGFVTARFEERSRVRGNATLTDLQTEFGNNWKTRWQRALDKLDYVQKHYNALMKPEYREKVLAHGMKVNEFLMLHAEDFFTRHQLIEFLYEVGNIENPEALADNFKRRYKNKCDLECYTMSDCQYVVNEINRAADSFLNNEIMSKMTQIQVV